MAEHYQLIFLSFWNLWVIWKCLHAERVSRSSAWYWDTSGMCPSPVWEGEHKNDPDAICGRTLRHSADQLSEVFNKLFQTYNLENNHYNSHPKIYRAQGTEWFWPFALTFLVMNNFENIFLVPYWWQSWPLAVSLHSLGGVEAHGRLLFADLSSATNKMQRIHRSSHLLLILNDQISF